jgi:hypothetical protein
MALNLSYHCVDLIQLFFRYRSRFSNSELKYLGNCLREKSIFLRPERAAEKILLRIFVTNIHQ